MSVNTVTTTTYGFGPGDPALIGNSSTSLIGFYGTSPVAQPSAITTVAVTAPSAGGSPYGFTTYAQATGVIQAINSLISALSTLGLTA